MAPTGTQFVTDGPQPTHRLPTGKGPRTVRLNFNRFSPSDNINQAVEIIRLYSTGALSGIANHCPSIKDIQLSHSKTNIPR